MSRFAPRYDPRVVAAIRRLDDRRVSIAEVCRRLGDLADGLGVPRPSYVHLRRLVVAEREREDDGAEVVREMSRDFFAGRRIATPHEIESRRRSNP